MPREAIALLETGQVDEISLDHDLGDDRRGTGHDVLAWLEEAVALHRFMPPIVHVHTANPVARLRMLAAVAAIERLAGARAPAHQDKGPSTRGPDERNVE